MKNRLGQAVAICATVMVLAVQTSHAQTHFLEYATDDLARWTSDGKVGREGNGGYSDLHDPDNPTTPRNVLVAVIKTNAAQYAVWVAQTPADVPQAVRDAAILAAENVAGDSGVRDHAASNIVVMASAYGVTDQPISWAAVATAMQVERIDATASNDVMRLLTVIGDGTTLLSFKEFYSENGGDVFNVRWP